MSYPDETTINAVAYFFDDDTQVLGLPCRTRVRFFLKAGTVITRWEDSAGYYPAFKLRARLFKLLLRILVTLFPMLFHCLRTKRLHQPDVPFSFVRLKESFPELDRCVVMLGAEDDNRRKAIVCLKSHRGIPVAYVKWGARPLAQKKVINEGRMLAAIPAHTGPEILAEWDLAGQRAICLSPVMGKILPKFLPEVSNRMYWDEIISFLSKLSEGERTTVAFDHPWIRGLMQRSSFDFSEVLLPLTGTDWPVVVAHGDFTPWNLVRGDDGRLIAIDWEDGSSEGFIWADLVYYVIQTGALMHAWSPGKIRGYLSELLQYCGVGALEAQSIIRLVSLEAYLKGCEDGVSPACHLQKVRMNLWERV